VPEVTAKMFVGIADFTKSGLLEPRLGMMPIVDYSMLNVM
jgi:hypothetical protein